MDGKLKVLSNKVYILDTMYNLIFKCKIQSEIFLLVLIVYKVSNHFNGLSKLRLTKRPHFRNYGVWQYESQHLWLDI